MCRNTREWVTGMVAMMVAAPGIALGASSLPAIGYCDGCSVAMQWRLAAEAKAHDLGALERVGQKIYIVDRVGEAVAAFSVRPRGGTGIGAASDKENEGGRRGRGERGPVEVVRIEPDPAVQRFVLAGLRAANEVDRSLAVGRIPIEDLGLAARVPSAIDLVGPESSDAGGNRAALGDALESYVNRIIGDAAATLDEPARAVMAQLLTDSSKAASGGFVIAFPDGTTIRVALNGLQRRLPRRLPRPSQNLPQDARK